MTAEYAARVKREFDHQMVVRWKESAIERYEKHQPQGSEYDFNYYAEHRAEILEQQRIDRLRKKLPKDVD